MRYGVLLVRAAGSLAAIGGASPVNLPSQQAHERPDENAVTRRDQSGRESAERADARRGHPSGSGQAFDKARMTAPRPYKQAIGILHGRAAQLTQSLPLHILPDAASGLEKMGGSDGSIDGADVQFVSAAGSPFLSPSLPFTADGTNPNSGSGGGKDGGGTIIGGGDGGPDRSGDGTPPVAWPPQGGTDPSGGGGTDAGDPTILPSSPTGTENNPGDGSANGDPGGSLPHPPLPPIETVPEPATWAIFTLGVFAVGLLMRRRRSNTPSHRLPLSLDILSGARRDGES